MSEIRGKCCPLLGCDNCRWFNKTGFVPGFGDCTLNREVHSAKHEACEHYEEHEQQPHETLKSAIDYLTEIGWLPEHDRVLTERPHGEWIPCSEQLPEEKISPVIHDFDEVLCTTIWGDVRTYKYGRLITHDEAHFWYGFGIMDEEVIAWMPLPEPYEKEGEAE